MPSIHRHRRAARAALVTLALAAPALPIATAAAGADPGHHAAQRLVVRGEDTVADAPCQGPVCHHDLTDGSFRGTLGSGAYAGSIDLAVAEAFDNGEGGLCAPVRGRLVLGVGTPDRLTLAFTGDSCQDGHGPVTAASFTGLARFTVADGTGAYRHATGAGQLSATEDANDHEQLTLIGRIRR
jgi:hypothetical protein